MTVFVPMATVPEFSPRQPIAFAFVAFFCGVLWRPALERAMNSPEVRARLDELAARVIQEAGSVRRLLGYGFAEKVYENALAIRLKKAGIRFQQQEPIQVHFEGEVVGAFVPDLYLTEGIILEIKACNEIRNAFRAQVLNYLCATGNTLGLILNFGPDKLEVARVVHHF